MKKPTRRNAGGPGRTGDVDDHDDRAHWAHVTSSIKPLKTKSRVLAAAWKAEDTAGKPSPTRAAQATMREPPQLPVSPPSKPPPLSGFNPRHARKIRSGRVEIERRVDLHGMRRNEAYGALRRFLFDCHEQGRRCVLVITGKGDPRRRREDDYGWGAGDTGVLKREVPQWLAEPELRAIVVSFTTAAAQHGGEGALYVHLRRPERTV